jgi:hypothetical protein
MSRMMVQIIWCVFTKATKRCGTRLPLRAGIERRKHLKRKLDSPSFLNAWARGRCHVPK